MRHAEASVEAIARAVQGERRKLARQFKELTPEPLRSQIYQRTLSVYGNAAGPTIDWLREQGKTWDDIIESAARPGSPLSLVSAG